MIKYLVILFSLFAFSRSYLQYRKHHISFLNLLFWLVFWTAVSILIWEPQRIDSIAQWMGIERGVDFALYIAVLLIFYLVFRLYVRVEVLHEDIGKIVEKTAIHNSKHNKKDK